MMKKYFLAALLFAGFFKVSAQNISLVSNKANAVTVNNAVDLDMALPVHSFNGDYYTGFGNTVLTMQKGAPALPVYRTSVMVPGGGNVTLEVRYDSFTEMSNINILPSKGSLTRNIKPDDVPYEFGADYSQDAFYPGKLAEISSPYILRDTRGTTVSIYPYQYNPVTKKLRMYHNITVTVVTEGNAGINTKNTAVKPTGKLFTEVYKNHYINARTLDTDAPATPTEMLVIAPQEFVETIAPLADWKNQSGIKTTVATLNETGFNADEIKQYIQDFYAENPALAYVLLVGDHADLPTYSYGISGGGEELWSDTYYAQLEGDDFYPEVFIGRFSGSIAEVGTMVSRTLEYETAPLEGDWMTRFAGIGSNEGDGYGDDGEPDWQHLRNIGTKLLTYGYTFGHEFFDGSHGGNDQPDSPSNTMISDAVNEGVGLINYTGHGATEAFATGWYTNDDVIGLANTGKYPFIISVACNNGTFAYNTSICEAWLRTEVNGSPTGAVAACGSSILMAWAEPMQTQDEMTELIIKSGEGDIKRTLGELFYNGQLSMLQTYGESATAIEIMQTWVLFGDPSVTYRNAPNQELVVAHAAQITDADQTLTVTSEVEGATIAITQNGVIVGTGVIVNGQAIITLADFDPELPLTVTATMQNFTPYQATVAVTLGTAVLTANTIKLYPNPAGANLTVQHNIDGANAQYEVFDVSGKKVSGGNVAQGNTFSINTNALSNGMYLLKLTFEAGSYTAKFVKK